MGLKDVIERMVVDEGFKNAVLENAEQAVSAGGFEVSAEEMEALKNLKAEDLEGASLETLDERLSKRAQALTAYSENIQS